MLTEKITKTSFITLHLPWNKTFEGVIIADFGASIQMMPMGCSINFNLAKEELEFVNYGQKQGECLPRYTMKLPNGTQNVRAQEFLDRFAE